MYRHRRKQLPPTPPPAHGDGRTRQGLQNPLSEGTYSHPRAAPLPPPPPPQAQVSDPVITPSFPLDGALPGLLPLGGTGHDTQPQPQPQPEPRRRPLRPAPWRTPTSPQRPPPAGRWLDGALVVSSTPGSQGPARRKTSRFRSGSLPGTYHFRELDEQISSRAEWPGTAYSRDDGGVQISSRKGGAGVVVPPVLIVPSGLGSGGMSPAVDGVQGHPHRRGPSAFGIPNIKPKILSKLPTGKLVAGNDHGTAEEKGDGVSTNTSRRVDDVEGQVLGLRVPLRKGSKNHGGVGRRQSPDSIYSQDMEGSKKRESIFAETYHRFMFGEHGNGEERSQGCVDSSEKKGDDRRWEPLRTTPGPPLGSHYRRQNPIVPSREPRDRLEGWGEGEHEPTSPTFIRTCTGTTPRIIRKPAILNLRPPSTQQVLRTPSPLSATLKRPGPHVPHGGRLGLTFEPTSANDVPACGASHAAPMFARELTASPEVMSSVAAEEDDRRGMVSRWSTDSSDISDSSNSSDEEMDREGLTVSGRRRLTREAGGEARQDIAQEIPSAQDNSSSSSGNNNDREHSPASQETRNEGIEQQKSEEPIFPLGNLTTQLANLQASLNHLVSQVTSVETAFGPVREAMVGLRQKATETLVDTRQFLEEAKGVERQLAEARRQVKGKATEVVGNSEDHQEQVREQEENGRHKEGNDDHKGKKAEENALLEVGVQFCEDDVDKRVLHRA